MATSQNETCSNFYPNCDINVWLRTCNQEIPEPIAGTITGTIPSWLNGSLLRNGPGSLKAGNDHFEHLFDCSALLHRFCIEHGNVTYQCRFLRSEVFKKNQKANRIVVTEFGTKAIPDPCRTIFRKVAAVFNPKSGDISDNSMISLYPFGDEIYAFGEAPTIHKINPENLETEGRVQVSDYASTIVHHTSHPHVMSDGSVYNLALALYKTGPRSTIVKFPANQKSKDMFQEASIVAGIPVRWTFHPSYMHSFGITENYFVIVEQPLSISVGALVASKLKNEPLAGCFRWYQDKMTQINLIDRKTGKLAFKFFSDPFAYFHIINQYEISNHVIIDICTYRDAAMLEAMYIKAMKILDIMFQMTSVKLQRLNKDTLKTVITQVLSEGNVFMLISTNMHQNENYAQMLRSTPLRFILPLEPEKSASNLVKLPKACAEAYFLPNGDIFVKPEKLCSLGCELPRINYENYLGKEYRYFYAIISDVDGDSGSVIKVDTLTKTTKTWYAQNCYASEPIFVPSPDSKFEDDGVVLAAIVWGNEDVNRVGLLVLDAQNFEEIGRAEFETPGQVPKCLHGWFVPTKNEELDNY